MAASQDGAVGRGSAASISQLHERYNTLSRDVGELSADLRATRNEMATRTDINRIESAVSSLAGEIKTEQLGRKPNYFGLISVFCGAVGTAVSLIAVFGNMALAPVRSSIDNLGEISKDLRTQVVGTATKDDLNAKLLAEGRLRDSIKEALDRRMDTMERDKQRQIDALEVRYGHLAPLRN